VSSINWPSGGGFAAAKSPAPRSRYTGAAPRSTSNWPSGLIHVSSRPLVKSTGRGAQSATRQCWSNGNRSGRSLNSLKRALNQWGNLSLICVTVSGAFKGYGASVLRLDTAGFTLVRLGAEPPVPA